MQGVRLLVPAHSGHGPEGFPSPCTAIISIKITIHPEVQSKDNNLFSHYFQL
jgi:hypothetical protein